MSEQSQIYKAIILEHYKHPHNWGELSSPTYHFKESNLTCGDELEFFVQIVDGKVKDVKFKGRGCAISLAAASILSEKIVNQPIANLSEFTPETVLKFLGMERTSPRAKCGLLAWEALVKNLITKA